MKKESYWVCIIGSTDYDKLPDGSDSPMRISVSEAFNNVTGQYAQTIWSGWGADKKDVERILKAWNEKT